MRAGAGCVHSDRVKKTCTGPGRTCFVRVMSRDVSRGAARISSAAHNLARIERPAPNVRKFSPATSGRGSGLSIGREACSIQISPTASLGCSLPNSGYKRLVVGYVNAVGLLFAEFGFGGCRAADRLGASASCAWASEMYGREKLISLSERTVLGRGMRCGSLYAKSLARGGGLEWQERARRLRIDFQADRYLALEWGKLHPDTKSYIFKGHRLARKLLTSALGWARQSNSGG